MTVTVFPQPMHLGPNKDEQIEHLSSDGLSPPTPEIEFLGSLFGSGEPDANKIFARSLLFIFSIIILPNMYPIVR